MHRRAADVAYACLETSLCRTLGNQDDRLHRNYVLVAADAC